MSDVDFSLSLSFALGESAFRKCALTEANTS